MLVGSEPVRLRPCTSMMATDCEMAAVQAEAVDSGAVAQHVMPYLQPPQATQPHSKAALSAAAAVMRPHHWQ